MGDMIGDFASKAVQCALFRKFRDQIMGLIGAKDSGPSKCNPKNPNSFWYSKNLRFLLQAQPSVGDKSKRSPGSERNFSLLLIVN